MLKSKTACLRLVISLKVTPIVRTLMLCERSLNLTAGNAPKFSVDAERSSKRQCDIALLCVWNSPIFGLSRAELLRLRFNHTSSPKNCMRLLSRPERIYPENLGAPRAQLPAWVMKVTNFWISPTTIVVGESASSRRPRVLIWTSRVTCPELNFDFEIDTYWTTYKKHQNAGSRRRDASLVHRNSLSHGQEIWGHHQQPK